MEMKHRQEHISLRCSNQGFTIVELMVAMVVSLLAMAAIYSTFQAQFKSYQVQGEAADMQQNIRAAMYYMQREIRMAGSNPSKSLPLSAFGVTVAGPTSITFTEDVNGGAPGTPPDGAITATAAASENITYNLDANRNLIRTVGGVGQVVAQNIDWLDFVYLDGGSPPTYTPNPIPFDVSGNVSAANLSQIRSVEITIVARTNDPLLYGTTNNNVYTNQQPLPPARASFGPVGDNVSRRRLTTQIYCRNLDL
jgi:prepilin-type N-terminal cleavage/methylation domain-containing protein